MAAASPAERPRLALVSLGCRVSRGDLDAAAAALDGACALAAPGEPADLVLIQTCTVTNGADQAARKAVRLAARVHPGARIVVAGCYAEVAPEACRALPGVAAVVGARTGGSVAAAVARLLGRDAAPAEAPPFPARHTRAVLKVQDGCDAACAYCILPRARGPSRSLAFEEALARLAALGRGAREVVLAGIHLGHYGRDLSPRRTLEALVARAAADGLAHRLRLSSIEPLEAPLALFRGPAAERLCPQLHLPLQSGSDRILAAMRRPYRAAGYLRVLEEAARALPGGNLGADVMAGFPGETEEDHRATIRLVEASPLTYLHVFTWSPREGTPAADLPGAVPGPVARERAAELLDLSRRRRQAYLAAQRGRQLEVVVERVEGGFCVGTARSGVTVRWPAGGEARGALAQVVVTGSDGRRCLGRARDTP
ncbi:MiaB/RimO family radical SAM methylthiotransferase [Anaeromyxobacter paludicola]|uniref:tRNA (N(6)-L-threonylcarbamoyladenosine(37)-C(2) )-methylthiotransferase MtaB n=1 Tax=Anaeromyxobacter paludicola TaxID=2918171 RepID=A0ABM7X7N7_9BACT|nr:MiaB/RimO family radical SAM methylthiotransferase [Anaeromyxobacter paludicola]BDG07868.1 tRNA (N(6)-L-threonylcarbamoyladenosine(37)-C(2))-methylthiotransferase MtaB [Anaeromyxobacter paludicola]